MIKEAKKLSETYVHGLSRPTDEDQMMKKCLAIKEIYTKTCKDKNISFAKSQREIAQGTLSKELAHLRRAKYPKLKHEQLETIAEWIKSNHKQP